MTEALSTQAHAAIINMILLHQLPPGAALQELKLADALNMSRTPVREALKRIEAEGLAYKDGRFLRIKQLEIDEVQEIFSLRQTLEGFCARQAISLPQADISQMADKVRNLMTSDDSDEQRRVDHAFHEMIASAGNNTTMARTISDLRMRTCMFDIHQVPHRFLAGCHEHLEILSALAARDADRAQETMTAHVRHAGEAVIARLTQLQTGARTE